MALSSLILASLVAPCLSARASTAPNAPIAPGQEAAAGSMSLLQTLDAKAKESEARSNARFARAFSELHASAQNKCPYGDEERSTAGGESNFECHWKSPGAGKTCPGVQTERIKIAHTFMARSIADFVESAKDYSLSMLFDKSDILVGDESYEDLVLYQIEGLKKPEVKGVEDKIYLKDLAQKLKVPATIAYYGAHKSDWDQTAFRQAMQDLCDNDVDGFIVKATHLAWSAGQKIVTDWRSTCKNDAELSQQVDSLVTFVENEVIGQMPRDTDGHLLFLDPGVTVEELFRTGGDSVRPLEAKVIVVWGKVQSAFFIGNDNRGCKVNPYSWVVFGDGTGWDLQGPISSSGGGDPVNDRFLREAWDLMVQYAESFARGVKADYMRVDFFIGIEEDQIVVKMNECESVSGAPAFYDRQGVAQAWRDGYVVSGKWHTTEEKYEIFEKRTQADRDAKPLDQQ